MSYLTYCASCNKDFKLMIGICGHKYCEKCLDLLLEKSNSFKCLECSIILRRESFELGAIEKRLENEIKTRQSLLEECFNLTRDNFNTKEEYDNYLEEVEDILYKKVNNIDKVEVQNKIEKFKEENKELIEKNYEIGKKDKKEILKKIEEEETRINKLRALWKEEREIIKKEQRENKEKLISDMKSGKIVTEEDLKKINNELTINSKKRVIEKMEQRIKDMDEMDNQIDKPNESTQKWSRFKPSFAPQNLPKTFDNMDLNFVREGMELTGIFVENALERATKEERDASGYGPLIIQERSIKEAFGSLFQFK